MSGRSIPIWPSNLAIFEESWIFEHPNCTTLDTCGAQMRYDVILNFTPIFIFSSLHNLYLKMVTSEGGGICAYPYLWQGPIHKTIRNKVWKLGAFYFHFVGTFCPTECQGRNLPAAMSQILGNFRVQKQRKSLQSSWIDAFPQIFCQSS